MATLRHMALITGQLPRNNPACVDICPPTTCVEKKQSQRERSFDFSYLLQGKHQTCLVESGDIDIKKPVANAVPESEKKENKIQTNE